MSIARDLLMKDISDLKLTPRGIEFIVDKTKPIIVNYESLNYIEALLLRFFIVNTAKDQVKLPPETINETKTS